MSSSIPRLIRAHCASGFMAGLVAVVLTGCSAGASTSVTATTTSSAMTTSSAVPATTTAGLKAATWSSNVTLTYEDGYVEFKSDGLPNHARQSQYAVPNDGVRVPTAETAHAVADPTKAQSYDFKIPVDPRKASTTTSTSLGVIGVMISGAALFNPYEGDGSTVATASNFTVKDSSGNDVAFLDDCSGHPTPMGQYHYHALPACVTATVDTSGGPSHLIGIAFDGFPIYGDRDLAGGRIVAGQLDGCSGITSATPEFPQGIYHYVLLDTTDSTSSIRCFAGTVDAALTRMHGMPGGVPDGPPDGASASPSGRGVEVVTIQHASVFSCRISTSEPRI